MSQPQYGSRMDRQQPQFSKPGSVRAARKRFLAQMSPSDIAGQQQVGINQYVEPVSRIPAARPGGIPRNPRPQRQQQNRFSMRMDPAEQIGVAISQPLPIQMPIQQQQWPIQQQSSNTYQPPPGRSMPPPRPPRSSKTISMVANNQPQVRLQVPVPAQGQRSVREEQDYDSHNYDYDDSPSSDAQDSDEVNTAYTPSSRPSVSSVGSIPEFPVPVPPTPPPEPQAPPRRSVNLGPPPSSRRGASSFYSTQSYVEPIPEEASSQISRSHSSFASSMAIPDDFESDVASSPGFISDEDDQRSPVVYEARPGVMVTAPGSDSPSLRSESSESTAHMTPTVNPFLSADDAEFGPQTGRSFGTLNNNRPMASPSMSVTGLPINNVPQRSPQPVTPDHIRQSLLAAAETNPELLMTSPVTFSQGAPSQREYSRLSAIRRPPTLDIDAANGRNSTTTLPDMIRRATRLATLIDKGKRPASSGGDPEFKFVNALPNRGSAFTNGRQSGLSDMLAAFPPPAAAPSPVAQPKRTSRIRSMIRSPNSWPFPPGRSPGMQQIKSPTGQQFRSPLATTATGLTEKTVTTQQRGRRCCGLPLWGFITLLILLLVLAVAAVVVPLEFFVFHKGSTTSGSAESDTDECSSQLPCLNGGTSVMLHGECSCICINGFTGDDCSIGGATGCTTTTLVTNSNSTGGGISNVTLGLAIPRLIAEAQTAYSVPLSGTEILARFNSGNLSCVAQNSLVTFDGSATRLSDDDTSDAPVDVSENRVAAGSDKSILTITVPESLSSTATAAIIANKAAVDSVSEDAIQTVSVSSVLVTTVEVVMTSTLAESTSIVTTFTTSIPTTTTITQTSTTTVAASTFSATQDSIDFARVAVLYVLQETDVSQASTAQAALEDFLTRDDNITLTEAKNLTLGNFNFINLVNFEVTVGTSHVGNGNTTANVSKREAMALFTGATKDILYMGNDGNTGTSAGTNEESEYEIADRDLESGHVSPEEISDTLQWAVAYLQHRRNRGRNTSHSTTVLQI